MENSWQRKQGSLWRQPTPPPPALLDSRAQLSNADYRLHLQLLQESMSLTSGMTQEHMLPNMHGLENLGHAELGASFLSLISGPSAHVACDQQHLLDPTVPVSNLLPPSCGTAHGFSAGSRVSVLPGVSWPHNMDCQTLTSGEVFPPITLSNANSNCSNISEILQAASLDVKKSQTVPCQNSHKKDEVKSSYPPIGNNTSSGKHQKYPHITASQKISVESNASACRNGYNPSNNFLHVSCSGISGSLLLSDTGLLGVVCTCHGLYMSISQFSEHSGSCDVDPGNAVCMDNGDTVAHWWKAFSSRTGIRILEGHRGWDWPEGISVALGLTNHPISSMSNNIQFNQVGSFRSSVSHEHKNYSVINSKENQSCRNIVDEHLYHGRDRASQECSNSFFKYFMNISHENMPHAVGQHVRELANSVCVQSEKASQSLASTLDIISKSANPLLALPNLQDFKTSCNGFSDDRKNSLIVEKPGVSSSTELSLGQPPEKSRTLETKRQLTIGSNLAGVHEEPSKVFFQDKLLQTSNVWQGSGPTLRNADIFSNPPERRGPTGLEHSHGVGGAYGAATDCWKDLSNISLETTNVNSKLPPFFRNLETNCQFRNIYENSRDSHVGEGMRYESSASKRDKIYLPWSSLAGTTKEFGMDVLTAPSNMNEDKEVKSSLKGLLGAAKSNIEVSKESKEKASSSNLVLGESSTDFQGKNLNSHHMYTMNADKSYGREFLNNYWKISTHFNRDHVKPIQSSIVSEETPLGFSSKNSVFLHNGAPTLPKEKNNVIKKGFQYKNVEIPGAWNLLELSDRDNRPPAKSVQECEIIKNSCVQSPGISKDPTQLLDSLLMPRFSEMGDQSMVPSCWMGHNCERICSMTGKSLYTEDSVLPPVDQLSLRKNEHSSQGLPYTHVPEKCTSENYLARQNDLNGDKFCNLVRGDRSGAATKLLYSKLSTNCMFLKEVAESFDKAKSLVVPNIKSAESCSFQWRDVPKKVTENCSLTRKEKEAVSRSPLGCPAADVAKSFGGFTQVVVPLKEHEVSNISSGCSAPDVTQSSSEVNKQESYTTEIRNISFADSLVLDNGSGNGRSCSSDDALDSEFYGSASETDLIKRDPFKLVPKKQSLSLIEEIRLQNSLQSKISPHKIKRSYTFHEDSDRLQKFELAPKKKRKTVKWMKLDVSGHSSINNRSLKCSEEVGQNARLSSDMQMRRRCDQGSPSNCADSVEKSEKQGTAFSAAKWVSRGKNFQKVYHQAVQQKTEAHKSLVVDDTLKASEMFRKKRLRLDDASARPTEVQGVFCCSAEFTAKLTSLGGCGDSLGKSNFQKQMVRPTVYGKYGIISNGNPSKAPKIIPLCEVLKTAVSLADKSNGKADNCKTTSVKVNKMSGRHVKETALGSKSRVKKCGTHFSQPTELESSDCDEEFDTASCSATNGSDCSSYALQKCDNHDISDRKPGDKLNSKFKDGRKRSLHELLFKGHSSEVANSSFIKKSSTLYQTTSRCFGKVMEDAADGRAQISERNKVTGCSEKHQPENSDMFCCVCGGSDKDEHNQLLQCNRFLLKGLRDKAEAVDNKNVSFYRRCMPRATCHVPIPDSDSESLQPGEFLVCARTEGYKGRKREGFLHNHSRETSRNGGCLVPQEQLNAWLHIHRQKPQSKGRPKLSTCNVESDCRKAYARYKQSKSWKHLVVYKSGIHALGLYTSQFISCGAMVVEYVGEIVGLRVADRRESEYHSGKKLLHKSACYFFRIDKEHIIDATRKGGIARFVNHSCQPNCVAKVISVRAGKKVVFFAERDIYPGEEITYDYHFNHDEDEGEKIPCYCNSNNCRLYLN
ncbi:hypothetical protein C2S51_033029 [Perilla frutescens var. frutescens]|nr:hypothetical protein C2S51_033029 [Perilla frutescens var. frutescens]